MNILKKLIPTIICLGIFIWIINYINPPKSWVEASVFQILVFFIPLLFIFTFLFNLFTGYLTRSFSLALGMIVILVLESTGQLNPITGVVVILATILLATSFKKPTLRKRGQKGLTYKGIIPKLTKFERKKR